MAIRGTGKALLRGDVAQEKGAFEDAVQKADLLSTIWGYGAMVIGNMFGWDPKYTTLLSGVARHFGAKKARDQIEDSGKFFKRSRRKAVEGIKMRDYTETGKTFWYSHLWKADGNTKEAMKNIKEDFEASWVGKTTKKVGTGVSKTVQNIIPGKEGEWWKGDIPFSDPALTDPDNPGRSIRMDFPTDIPEGYSVEGVAWQDLADPSLTDPNNPGQSIRMSFPTLPGEEEKDTASNAYDNAGYSIYQEDEYYDDENRLTFGGSR